MDFTNEITVVFSEGTKEILNDYIQYVNRRSEDYHFNLNNALLFMDRIKQGESVDYIEKAEHELSEFHSNQNNAFIPIVVYPHAVSICGIEGGVPVENVKDLSRRYKSAVAIFTFGQHGASEVLLTHFGYYGKLLAECTRIEDCDDGEVIVVPDLTEVCKYFPFKTSAKLLECTWETSRIIPLAKRVGYELGIDIHDENLLRFLKSDCTVIQEMGVAKIYVCNSLKRF